MNTLMNSFHGTSCKTRFTEADLQEIERILATGRGSELLRAKRQQRAIWKKLCGIKDCHCGDSFGRRA